MKPSDPGYDERYAIRKAKFIGHLKDCLRADYTPTGRNIQRFQTATELGVGGGWTELPGSGVLNGPEPRWRREYLLSIGFTLSGTGVGARFKPPPPGTYVRARVDILDRRRDGTEYSHGAPGAIGVIMWYHRRVTPTVLWGNHPEDLDTYEHPHGWAERCTGFGVYDVDLVAMVEVISAEEAAP